MSTEPIAVLDENGKPTGQILTRSEVHDKGLWHAVVFVWLVNSKGEVLLQLRAPDRLSFPGKWDISAGGHLQHGDNPVKAAIRELQEEIGVKAAESELIHLGECTDEFKDIKHRSYRDHVSVFLLKKDVSLEDLKLQDSEVSDVQYISVEELETAMNQPDWTDVYAARNRQIYSMLMDYEQQSN